MKNPYQRKAAAKSGTNIYNPQELYKQFIEQMVTSAGVVALYQDGWALCSTPTGQRAFAIWRNQGLAKLVIKDNWANYEPQFIGLKDFVDKVIPFLRVEKTTVSLDLTPEGQNILIAPEKLLVDLKNYLYQLYIQKPELFKDSELPLPRNIRLN